MPATKSPFIEGLVSEEIRRLVAEAIADGGIMSVANCVAKVVAVYPNCGISKRQIADEVMMAAAAAGVAVEIGPIKEAARESARKDAAPPLK